MTDIADAHGQPTPGTGDTERDDLNHLYCCNRDRAMCGADLTGLPEGDGDDTNCDDCLDLEEVPCPVCGVLP